MTLFSPISAGNFQIPLYLVNGLKHGGTMALDGSAFRGVLQDDLSHNDHVIFWMLLPINSSVV